VLREDWGFRGFVVSDANAVKNLQTHGFAKDEQDAAVRALSAGVNMEMATGHTAYDAGLPSALKEGLVTQEEIDNAVRPILEMKLRLGLFDHPYVDETKVNQVLSAPDHRVAARIAAERSAVLLRNEGGLLPLKKDGYRRIAIIGPLADSKLDTIGSWGFQQNLPETVTVKEGLQNELGSAANLFYERGAQLHRTFPSMLDAILNVKPEAQWTAQEAQLHMDKAVELARTSDLTIMVLGEGQNMSGEAASRQSMELPDDQQKLLEAVSSTGKPVVLVLMNGRPLNIVWASEHVPAILEAWYPGSQGGNAIANLLVGDAVPGGKLPISWPRNVGQIPMPYAHNITHEPENQEKRYWDVASTPLYPFGYGLSYTNFRFGNLQVNKKDAKLVDRINVSVDVTNAGSIKGDEVVQLYTHQRYGGASRPVRELKGFSRISLSAGETKTVHFTLGREQLEYWNAASHGWTYDPSTYDIWVGPDSRAELHEEISVAQ
jgi:beta-glucosidase